MKILIPVIVAVALAGLCVFGLYKFMVARARIDLSYALARDLSSYYRINGRFPSSWDAFVKWSSSGNSPRKWDAQSLSARFILNANATGQKPSNREQVITVLDETIKPYESDINHRLTDQAYPDLAAHPSDADVTFDDLFHLSPMAAESSLGAERFKMLRDALDDFNAVINFKPPVHAQIDHQAALPSDGGTSFYKGNGYTLTVTKSLFAMGSPPKSGVNGFLYGPVITFHSEIGAGNSLDISRVSFYPVEALNKSLKRHSSAEN